MRIKKVICLSLTVIMVTAFAAMLAACSEKYNLKTPIGTFNMTAQVTDKYEHAYPSDGNQYLVVTLIPQESVSVKQMQEYFRPDNKDNGAIAECGDTEYSFSSMQFKKDDKGNDICIIIFEVPQGLADSDRIALKLPKAS